MASTIERSTAAPPGGSRRPAPRPAPRSRPGARAQPRRAGAAPSPRDGVLEPAGVGDDQLVALEPEEVLLDKVREHPVHRLASPRSCRPRLGYGQASRIGPLGLPGSGPRRRRSPRRRPSAAGGGRGDPQVEEVEVGDLPGQAPDLAGERGEHRASQGGLGIDEAIERVTSQDQRFDGPDGDRRRSAGGRRAVPAHRRSRRDRWSSG